MNKRKVVIIGAGHVGSHCAMALAFGGVCEEIVLLDTDLEKARANAMDVADACLRPAVAPCMWEIMMTAKRRILLLFPWVSPASPGKRGWTCWTTRCVCSGMCVAT